MFDVSYHASTPDLFKISLINFPFLSLPIAPKNFKSFSPSAAKIRDELSPLPPRLN